MDQEFTSPAQEQTNTWPDWRYLVLLCSLVLPLHGWLLCNTEVAARDSIGFIRYALQFETRSWKDVLTGNQQHPGFPLAIWAVSQPIRAMAGTTPETMCFSAQLVSALTALALLFPMYYLGKELFSRSVGFWAALFFQYLPVGGHLLSDGISEALFLFLLAMALWRGVVAIRTYEPKQFLWCGLWGGLAYFTRPEGALVVLAAGLVLTAMQLTARWRRPWTKFAACGLSLSLTAAAVGGVFAVTVGGLTNKNAPKIIFAQHQSQLQVDGDAPRGPLLASVFGVFIKKSDDFTVRTGRSVEAMGTELSNAFHYVGWVPALLGLWSGWRRFVGAPVFWLLGFYCLLHGIILFLLAMAAAYVSDRHVQELVLCGTYLAVVGVRDLAQWLCEKWRAGSASDRSASGRRVSDRSLTLNPPPTTWLTAPRLTALLLLGLILFCLPKTVQRLHGNRLGNRLAGLWLRQHLGQGDVVEDDHAYSHYYAGLVFEEEKKAKLPKGSRPKCFYVVTRSKDSEVLTDRKKTEEKIRAQGKQVYQWPEQATLENARVVIYELPRDKEQHGWEEE
jgi:hypothetical protein